MRLLVGVFKGGAPVGSIDLSLCYSVSDVEYEIQQLLGTDDDVSIDDYAFSCVDADEIAEFVDGGHIGLLMSMVDDGGWDDVLKRMDALLIYCRNSHFDSGLSWQGFDDSYLGVYDSYLDFFVKHLGTEVGTAWVNELVEANMATYFDFDRCFENDYKDSYWSEEDGGKIHVFRNA